MSSKQRIVRVAFVHPVDLPGSFDSNVKYLTGADYAITAVNDADFGFGVSIRSVDAETRKPVGQEMFVPQSNIKTIDLGG